MSVMSVKTNPNKGIHCHVFTLERPYTVKLHYNVRYHLLLQVIKLILQGILLIPPEGCPPFIYKLMELSWKTEPNHRIKFPGILADLIQHLSDNHRHMMSVQRDEQELDEQNGCS